MVRDPLVEDDDPDVGMVVEALHDEDCRVILEELEEPRTASELLDRCEIPRSTLYRKLDLLTETGLVETRLRLGPEFTQSTEYSLAVEEFSVSLGDVLRISQQVDDGR